MRVLHKTCSWNSRCEKANTLNLSKIILKMFLVKSKGSSINSAKQMDFFANHFQNY